MGGKGVRTCGSELGILGYGFGVQGLCFTKQVVPFAGVLDKEGPSVHKGFIS